jgi:hypothetical protein
MIVILGGPGVVGEIGGAFVDASFPQEAFEGGADLGLLFTGLVCRTWRFPEWE